MKRFRPEFLAAGAAYSVLAVVLTWPLAGHLWDQIALAPPALDPVSLLYAVTWGARALAGDPLHYFDASLFYPGRGTLASFDLMAGLSAIAAPIDRLTGDFCLGFNAAWLATFVVSGVGVYLLARHLTGRPAPAFLAGVLYAFHPFRYHNAGQINVLAVMWMPLALLCLHLWVRRRRRRHLVLAAFFAVVQFLSSGYTGVFLLVAVGLYLGWLLLRERRATLDLLRRDRFWIAGAAVAGLAAILPFAIPYLAARLSGSFHRGIGESALYSARGVDFLTPAQGSLFRPLAVWASHARHPLFPGVTATALAILWLGRRGWRGHPWRMELLFYGLLAVVGCALAFGPFVPGPGFRVPLPFALLWFALPGASFIRAPVRFVTLMSLGMAVVAAAGLAGAGASGGKGARNPRADFWRACGEWAVVGLAVLELSAAPIRLIRPLPREIPGVYAWLARQPGPVAIAELPMQPDEYSENDVYARYQLFSLLHGKRLVNGVAAFQPPITRDLYQRMRHFPDDASVSRLKELGVGYVFVHADLYPGAALASLRAALATRGDLEIVSMDDPVWVVRIVGRAAG